MGVSVEIFDGQFFHLFEHLVTHALESFGGDSDENVVVKIMKPCAHDVHCRHNADDTAEVLHGDFRRPCDDFRIGGDVHSVCISKRKDIVVDDNRAEHKRTCDVAKHVCDHANQCADKLTSIRFPIPENTLQGLHRVLCPKLVLSRRFFDVLFFVFTH